MTSIIINVALALLAALLLTGAVALLVIKLKGGDATLPFWAVAVVVLAVVTVQMFLMITAAELKGSIDDLMAGASSLNALTLLEDINNAPGMSFLGGIFDGAPAGFDTLRAYVDDIYAGYQWRRVAWSAGALALLAIAGPFLVQQTRGGRRSAASARMPARTASRTRRVARR